jgi:acyl-CoA reductase-like NAD-dependent aldehyde dehydrogenase
MRHQSVNLCMLPAFDRAEEEDAMGRRSEMLADRILQGAEGLASFAEKLSDADWTRPLSTDGSDRRPIGVIVNHVAFVYPIEVDAAKGIGSGQAVPVSWDDIAQLNAKHAGENAKTAKSETIALLRRNSRAAADAVRQMTDEQLDTAAPFGLSYGAPVTAQFVIEDHALRHSWHHLAKIKRALGR